MISKSRSENEKENLVFTLASIDRSLKPRTNIHRYFLFFFTVLNNYKISFEDFFFKLVNEGWGFYRGIVCRKNKITRCSYWAIRTQPKKVWQNLRKCINLKSWVIILWRESKSYTHNICNTFRKLYAFQQTFSIEIV